MKKMKFFAVALAALTMVSCSKENGVTPESGDTKIVSVTISNPQMTKADEAGVADETAVTINDGVIYFTNDNGDILQGTKKFTKAEIDAANNRLVCNGVASTATKVYVVANIAATQAAVGLPTAGNIQAVYNKVIAIAASRQAIENVIISGGGVINNLPPATATATAKLIPALARIEIKSLDGNKVIDANASKITAFKVIGIYIDNFYKNFSVVGEGSVPHYTKQVVTDLPGEPFCDIFTKDNSAVDGKFAPKRGAWAYQFGAGLVVPSIIIELDSVKIEGVALTGKRYVTVKHYIKREDASAYTTNTQKGHIYRISNISFNETHLAEVPNPEAISVEVAIEVFNWKFIDLDPVL